MPTEISAALRRLVFERALDGPVIRPLTPEGRVTVKILRLNDADRIEERELLIKIGLHP